MKHYDAWFTNANSKTKRLMKKMSAKERDLQFNSIIKFGTAGLRGIMTIGPNAINDITICNAAFSYGSFLKPKSKIVIAYDNRKNSLYFAKLTTNTLTRQGHKVFLFKEPTPTPLLSYVILNHNFNGGINITASHNPKEYNGFKIYDNLGTQISGKNITIIEKKFIENIDKFDYDFDVKKTYKYIDNSICEEYINRIVEKLDLKQCPNLKLAFSPQHGTGLKCASLLFKKMNANALIIKSQAFFSETFKNTKSPNPQNMDSYLVLEKESRNLAIDVLITTDPDADRIGIKVKHHNKWEHLDGNVLPLLQFHYLVNLKKIKKKEIIKSFVTSDYISFWNQKMKYDFNIINTYTGFRFLINKVKNKKNYLCAYEESYGSNFNLEISRDKDSFQSMGIIIEMIEHYKLKNKTLIDVWNEIQTQSNLWLLNIQKTTRHNNIDKIMKELKALDFFTIKKTKIDTKMNIYSLTITSEDLTYGVIHIRPSGTEPIVRIYFDFIFNKDIAIKYQKRIKILEF